MKTYTTFIAAACFASAAVAADTSYWVGSVVSSGNWGLSSNAANWSGGAVPSATTDVIFDADSLTGKATAIQITSGFVCNDYTINENYTTHQIRLDGSMTVNGDFLYKSQNSTGTSLLSNGSNASAATLNIGGGLIVGVKGDTASTYNLKIGETTSNEWGGWGGPKNVRIGGDIHLYEMARLAFNTNLKGRTADYANPDIFVGGVVNFDGNGSANPQITILNRTNKYGSSAIASSPVDVVFSSNGLKGNGVITNNSSGSSSASKVFVHLRNTGNQTFLGWIGDGTNCTTKIVMNGTGSQILSSNNYDTAKPTWGLSFTGGVEVISGTLEMNFAHQVNHGDLEMKGGVFKNYTSATSKNINFTNLIYSGGTVVTRWNGSAFDVYTLSGGLKKGSGFSAGDKFMIEISGDLTGLIGNEKKIFAWDNTLNPTDFTEDDFSATKLNGYEADFSIKDDGLYLQYIQAVPEPATVAAILAALALALALRNRKR